MSSYNVNPPSDHPKPPAPDGPRNSKARQTANPPEAEPVGVIRRFMLETLHHQAEMTDVALNGKGKSLPDGTLLYTSPASPKAYEQAVAARELLRVLNEGGNKAKAMQDLEAALCK